MTYFGGTVTAVSTLPGRKLLGNARVDYLGLVAFASGVQASFSSHWRSPGDWSMILYGHDYRITIDLRRNACRLAQGGRSVEFPQAPEDAQAKAGVLRQNQAFLDAVTARQPVRAPLCSIDAAIEALRLAELLRTS
jgi:predicted dehydrogenase